MKTLSSLHNPRPAPNKTKMATNQAVPCTHVGQITIRTNKCHSLKVTAVITPRVTSNLLSVRSISERHGNILFTPEVAYIFEKHSRDTVIGTAPWNPQIEAYAWISTPEPQARAARTRPIPKTQTQKAPQHTLKPTASHLMTTTAGPTGLIQSKDHIPRSIKLTPAPHIPEISSKTAHKTLHHCHLQLNNAPFRTIQNIAKTKTVYGLSAYLATTNIRLSCMACSHAKQQPARHKPTSHHYATGEYLISGTCRTIYPRPTHGNLNFFTYIDAGSGYVILSFLKSQNEVGIIMPQFFAQPSTATVSPKYTALTTPENSNPIMRSKPTTL